MPNSLPAGFVLDQSQPQGGLPPGFQLDIQQNTGSGYFNDLSNIYQNTVNKVGTNIDAGRVGQQTALQSGLWGTGDIAGGINQVIGRTLQEVPGYQTASNAVTGGAQKVADYLDTKPQFQAAGDTGLKAENAVSDWASNHPSTIKSMDAVANIFSAAPVVGGVMKGGANAFASIGESGAPLPPKPLPSEWQSLQDLPQASKTGIFASKPNAPEVGLRANQGISEQFDTAMKKANQLYEARDSIAAGKTIADNGIKDTVSSTVAALQKNPAIALDPKQSALLGKLLKIQDNLDSGIKTDLVDSSGAALEGKLSGQIPLSALTDLDESLSGFSKTNKFSDAAGHYAGELKALVNQKIGELRDIGHGDFVDAHNAAKAFYKNEVATKYLNNKELSPFWQPEDYYAWKNGTVTPSTLSRAATFLKDVNSKEAGRAVSIASILPKDLSKEIFRKAVIEAQNSRPSLLKAAGRLATGHIPSSIGMALEAVKPGNTSPLLDLAAQIKAMQK